MNQKELEQLISQGEGYHLEFKESLSASISKEIGAFANSNGGKILLGVNDDGDIKGINITNGLKSQIVDIVRKLDPSLIVDLERANDVLIINVPEGADKPYRCSYGFYIRQDANSQKLTRNEIYDFFKDLGKLPFDDNPTKIKDFDKQLVKQYFGRVGIKAPANGNTLHNLGVIDENGYLNSSGVLFFTNNPKKVFINAYITCARYKGTEKVNVIDRKDFEGDLVSQVERAMEFVSRNTRLEYEIKGLQRKEIPEYPTEAVREAVLNAVMHRDYLERGANVQIDIFDDRLTVTNIGGLIKPLTIKTLGTKAIRRNSLIADLFHRIHFVEKMGTGIKRIKEECKNHGNITFKVEANGYFIAKFILKKVTEKVTDRFGEKFGEGSEKSSEKILDIIKNNKKISAREIAEIIGISSRAVEKHIAILKEKGILKRIGSAKGGHWEIVEK